jgi:hypothetical protein
MPIKISLPACLHPMGENATQSIEPRYDTLAAHSSASNYRI